MEFRPHEMDHMESFESRPDEAAPSRFKGKNPTGPAIEQ